MLRRNLALAPADEYRGFSLPNWENGMPFEIEKRFVLQGQIPYRAAKFSASLPAEDCAACDYTLYRRSSEEARVTKNNFSGALLNIDRKPKWLVQ
jgi:hypothetical protein